MKNWLSAGDRRACTRYSRRRSGAEDRPAPSSSWSIMSHDLPGMHRLPGTRRPSSSSRSSQLQTRAQQLGQPLQTEGESIQTAVRALNGKAPDAALQARITALQTKQNSASQEIQREEQTLPLDPGACHRSRSTTRSTRSSPR